MRHCHLFRWKRLCLTLLAVSVTEPAAAETVPKQTSDGFAVPQPGARLEFPRDHGAHPAFRIEWWYLTGHLKSAEGGEFGYQATFFRNGMNPPKASGAEAVDSDSALFLGHMAISDLGGQRFYSEERLARGGWDAFAETEHLDLRLQNWHLEMTDDASESMRLQFSIESDAMADFVLRPSKPLLRFGEDGTSRKGVDPAARSYYLTFSRIETTGTIILGPETFKVTGSSWMDHEIASEQLSEGLAGWDWTALQLDDGWEIKAYILRQRNGEPDPFSRLYWISPEGETFAQTPAEFHWERTRWWESPTTGNRYPIDVNLTTRDPRNDDKAVTLQIRASIEAQELTGNSAGFAYWEGAGIVQTENGSPVGRSYLELVGYGREDVDSRLRGTK
jgi:predicted secreted hydrolase